jgi:hypothetical protein
MTRGAYLVLALSLPIIFVMKYSIQSQYQYDDREEITLPISWKVDNENNIFGYQFEFGLNPCADLNSNVADVYVCLKPIKKAFKQWPESCKLFIRGFCASNYFFPNYEQAASVSFIPAQINKSSKAEVTVKISKAGFAEVIQLRQLPD